MGEWKATTGIVGNCTKCAFGVTTLTEGSTAEQNCTQVIAGRYATSVATDGTVLATEICPQKYYWWVSTLDKNQLVLLLVRYLLYVC
jgi:hypothetical protein